MTQDGEPGLDDTAEVQAAAESGAEAHGESGSGAEAHGESGSGAEAHGESEAEFVPESEAAPVAGRSDRNRPARQRLAAVLGALVLVSAVIAGSVYWWLYRPDQLTGTGAQEQALQAAKVGTEALLSYGPDTLEDNLKTAKSHLTGDFLDHYSKFTDDVVTPAAKQRGVKTEASVARAAVSRMEPGRADVLLFVNQVTTSKDRPTPALATSSVKVTLVKRGGDWLISEFNPV